MQKLGLLNPRGTFFFVIGTIMGRRSLVLFYFRSLVFTFKSTKRGYIHLQIVVKIGHDDLMNFSLNTLVLCVKSFPFQSLGQNDNILTRTLFP